MKLQIHQDIENELSKFFEPHNLRITQIDFEGKLSIKGALTVVSIDHLPSTIAIEESYMILSGDSTNPLLGTKMTMLLGLRFEITTI